MDASSKALKRGNPDLTASVKSLRSLGVFKSIPRLTRELLYSIMAGDNKQTKITREK
jgi:hypothetical protein